jgi:hypothetical protein
MYPSRPIIISIKLFEIHARDYSSLKGGTGFHGDSIFIIFFYVIDIETWHFGSTAVTK